jgi:flagellar biosynthesis/type III secretory pathway protein FliH
MLHRPEVALNDRVQPDLEPLPTAAANDGIPARMWSDIEALTRLLDETRRVLQAMRGQAESLRLRADRDGHAAGVAKAQAEAVRYVLDAHQTARELIGASESRIISLVVSVVTRIAPTLDLSDAVMALLIAEARGVVRAEQTVRIHVGSGAVEATREMLQRWREAHLGTGSTQVLAEPRLAPFCSVVESEFGRIEVGRLQPLPLRESSTEAANGSTDTVFWLLREGDG